MEKQYISQITKRYTAVRHRIQREKYGESEDGIRRTVPKSLPAFQISLREIRSVTQMIEIAKEFGVADGTRTHDNRNHNRGVKRHFFF
jgi:hypothetical protein